MNQRIRNFIKALPGTNRLIHSKLWKSLRYRIILSASERETSTFTGFLRLPTQFDALSGPVIHFLFSNRQSFLIKIIVLGCSNGAEAYTVASVIKNRCTGVSFRVHAIDINEEILNKAKSASYSSEEVLNNKIITDNFINTTFHKENDRYTIRENISQHVDFGVADITGEDLISVCGTADVLFVQNVIFHMKPVVQERTFRNICKLLNPRAALFVDGMDLSIRTRLTRKMKLVPLEYEIEKIHNEARRARAVGWPYSYWGLEPLSKSRKEWQRRYATIFLKKETSI